MKDPHKNCDSVVVEEALGYIFIFSEGYMYASALCGRLRKIILDVLLFDVAIEVSEELAIFQGKARCLLEVEFILAIAHEAARTFTPLLILTASISCTISTCV